MKRNMFAAAAAVTAFVLLGAMTVNSQTAVTRPWTITADSQQVITLDTGAIEAYAWGEASHFGRFTSEGTGHMGVPTSVGIITAANGDLLTFEGGVEGLYTITGGTGRFVGATGCFVVNVLWMGSPVFHADGTMTIDLKWTAVGTITY